MRLLKVHANTVMGNFPFYVELRPHPEELDTYVGNIKVHTGAIVFATFGSDGNPLLEGDVVGSTGEIVANIVFDDANEEAEIALEYEQGSSVVLTASDEVSVIVLTIEIV